MRERMQGPPERGGRFTELIARLKSGQITKDELWTELEHVAQLDPAASSLPAASPPPPPPQLGGGADRARGAKPVLTVEPFSQRHRDAGSQLAHARVPSPAPPTVEWPYPFESEGGGVDRLQRARDENTSPRRASRPERARSPSRGAHPTELAYAQALKAAALASDLGPPPRADPTVPIRMDARWQAEVGVREAEQTARELAECTFAPRINASSRRPRNLYGGLIGHDVLDPALPRATVYERSRAWERERQKARADLQARARDDELSECTFRPKLVSRGRNLATRQAAAVERTLEPRARTVSPRRPATSGALAANGGAPAVPAAQRPATARRFRAQLGGVSARYLEPKGLRALTQPASPPHEPRLVAKPLAPHAQSGLAADYLKLGAFDRLSQQRSLSRATTPPAARQGGEGRTAAGAVQARARSAPRAGSAGAERLADESQLRFHQFLQRQARTVRRREAVTLRLDEAAEAMRVVKPLSERQKAKRARDRAEFVRRTNGSVAVHARRQQVADRDSAHEPSRAELAECTFRPRIHPTAAALRTRSVNELAHGDVLQRRLAQYELAQRFRAREDATLLPHPAATARVDGVEGLLKVSSDTANFVERMKERARLKQELLESVRDAQVRPRVPRLRAERPRRRPCAALRSPLTILSLAPHPGPARGADPRRDAGLHVPAECARQARSGGSSLIWSSRRRPIAAAAASWTSGHGDRRSTAADGRRQPAPAPRALPLGSPHH